MAMTRTRAMVRCRIVRGADIEISWRGRCEG
jgi:hypothetical protein